MLPKIITGDKILTNSHRRDKIVKTERGFSMKQHLIVLDLDGTLLTDNHTISPKTKQTLMKAKEAGHLIMIATGRPFRASNIYYQELGLTTPIVNFNGAYIHHPKIHLGRPSTPPSICGWCTTSLIQWINTRMKT